MTSRHQPQSSCLVMMSPLMTDKNNEIQTSASVLTSGNDVSLHYWVSGVSMMSPPLLMSLLSNMGSSHLAMMSPLMSDPKNEFQIDTSLMMSLLVSLLLSYVSMMSLLVFPLISVSWFRAVSVSGSSLSKLSLDTKTPPSIIKPRSKRYYLLRQRHVPRPPGPPDGDLHLRGILPVWRQECKI